MRMFRASSRLLRLCQRCGQKLTYRTTLNRSLRTLSIRSDLLHVSDEVSEELHSGGPVVALETTIITHGMPYPDNLRMATEAERLVRSKGVTPATIGIIQGNLHIGLNKSELEYLADPSTKSVKTSRRDFPYVMSQKLNGGTTVSGTMVAAHLAGIQVFVTGGIGGVHRGAENSMDISADLTELSRTPVAVVSAGVKSILDIGRTLEYLETEGVCVASYGDSKDFPAFFTRQCGFKAPYNVNTSEQAARLIDTTLTLGLQTGLLLAVPIPNEHEAEGKIIEAAIQTAVSKSQAAGITGKDVTPFILQRVNELTAGKSLEANIHLVKNNASVGSDIAIALSWLRKNGGGGKPGETKVFTKTRNAVIHKQLGKRKKTSPKDVVVIGGSIVDFYARLKQADLQLNGATYPGTVQQLFGGVGRNIADCLSRLGVSPLFISAIGNDSHKAAFQAHCSHMDLSGVAVLDDVSTATYFAILRDSGELVFGVGDMDIHSRITPEYISQFEEEISSAKLVCVDGNLTVQAIDCVCQLCRRHHVPVWFEPTDLHKASKPFHSSLSQPVTYTSPNLNELRVIASYLTKQTFNNSDNSDDLDKFSVIEESIHLLKVVAETVPVVIVTLGRHGAILCRHGDTYDKFKFPVRGHQLKTSGPLVMEYYPAFMPGRGPESVVSVSGAGDSMTAAIISGIVQGHYPTECMRRGLLAASISLQSCHTVPPEINPTCLSSENIRDRMNVIPELLLL